METRKVQVTGGSTYTVSLPKDWANQNDVSGGSVVEFYPEEDSLLLTPRREEEKVEGTIDIGGADTGRLERDDVEPADVHGHDRPGQFLALQAADVDGPLDLLLLPSGGQE